MSDNVKLGQIIESWGDVERDAVHVAITPVVATMPLKPGMHAGAKGSTANPIGIVDPFLKNPVETGQKFWLFLYPNTVTGMRHHWEHPAYPKDGAEVDHVKAASMVRISEMAGAINQTYDSMMDAAEQWVASGEYTYDNTESYKTAAWNPEEFWHHWEIVTGRTVGDEGRESFWTCSC